MPPSLIEQHNCHGPASNPTTAYMSTFLGEDVLGIGASYGHLQSDTFQAGLLPQESGSSKCCITGKGLLIRSLQV